MRQTVCRLKTSNSSRRWMFCASEDENLILILLDSWPACHEPGLWLATTLSSECISPQSPGQAAGNPQLPEEQRQHDAVNSKWLNSHNSEQEASTSTSTMMDFWLEDPIPPQCRVVPLIWDIGFYELKTSSELARRATAVIITSLTFLNASFPRAEVGTQLSKPEGWCQDCFIQQRWVKANKHH